MKQAAGFPRPDGKVQPVSTKPVNPSWYLKLDDDGITNYPIWKENFIGELGRLSINFGKLTTVFETGANYVPPPVTDGDVTNAMPAIAGINYSAEKKADTALRLGEARTKKIKELEEKAEAFFHAIMSTLSDASRILVEAEDDFPAALAAHDVAALIGCIQTSHSGDTNDDGEYTEQLKAKVELRFRGIKMRSGESAADYNIRFENARKTAVHYGVSVAEGSTLAYQWLQGLDSARYRFMVNHMINTKDLPTSTTEALNRTINWRATKSNGAGSIFASTVDDQKKPSGAAPKPPSKPAATKKGGKQQPADIECVACGKKGHRWYDCTEEMTQESMKNVQTFQRAAAKRRTNPPKKPDVGNDDWKSGKGTIAAVTTKSIGEEDEEDVLMFDGEYLYEDMGYHCMVETAPDLASPEASSDDGDNDDTHHVGHVGFAATDTILDTGAGSSVMKSTAPYVDNIQENPRPFAITDFNHNRTYATQQGTFFGTKVVVTDRGAVSVLSPSHLIDNKWKLQYNSVSDKFALTTPDERHTLLCSRRATSAGPSRHYFVEPLGTDIRLDDDYAAFTTVRDNIEARTRAEVKQAKYTRDRMDMIGGSAAVAAATLPTYEGSTITARDVHLANQVYGESLAHAKGSTVQRKPEQAVTEVRTEPHPRQVLEVDVAQLGKLQFLMGIYLPDHYVTAQHIKTTNGPDVAKALAQLIKAGTKNNVTTDRVRSDNDKAMDTDEVNALLEDKQIGLDLCTPGQHCAEIERVIRTVKDDYRGRQATSRYGWPVAVVILMVYAVVTAINMRCSLATAGTTYAAPPATRFLGRQISATKDMVAIAGQFCFVTELATSNSTEAPRVREAIYGYPTLSTDHGHRTLLLDTLQTVTRPKSAINVQPMPDAVIRLLDDAADEAGIPAVGLDIDPRAQPDHRQPATNDDDDDDDIEDVPLGARTSSNAPPRRPAGSTTPTHADTHAGSGVNDPPQIAKRAAELPPPPRRGRGGGSDTLTRLPSTAAALARPGYNDRVADIMVMHNTIQDDLRAAELMEILRPMADWRDAGMVLRIAVKKAMKTREVEATASITKELKQMIDMRVWRPVRMRSLPLSERMNFIRSQCFLKDKWTAAGIYDKLKARLVARGDMQDKTLYDNLSSPTVATTSLLVTAAIAASEGRHAMTLDVPCVWTGRSTDPLCE